MKIEIGQTFIIDGDSLLALNIPGLGIFNAIKDNDDSFSYVLLNRKQMVDLKREIDRELNELREIEFEKEINNEK